MRPAIPSLTAAFLAAVALAPAAAATLGLPTRGAPIISGVGVAFHDPLLGFDFLGNGSASSTAPALATDLLVTVPFADPSTPSGALFVTSMDGQSFLSGDLKRVGFNVNALGVDTIELLFGNLDGASAGAFRPLALMSLTGEFGADPLGAGFGSFADPVAVDVSVASAVPLPASLLMLLLGVGGLWGCRLTRRQPGVRRPIGILAGLRPQG